MTCPITARGLGFSAAFTPREVGKIEAVIPLLLDSPAAYEEWKRLVTTRAVSRVKVHDTGLVAL